MSIKRLKTSKYRVLNGKYHGPILKTFQNQPRSLEEISGHLTEKEQVPGRQPSLAVMPLLSNQAQGLIT